MNYALQYLCHMVQVKNEINRKRRRAWNWAFTTHRWYNDYAQNLEYGYLTRTSSRRVEVKLPKAFTRAEMKMAYEKAKEEMKAMTKEMSKVRKDAGARLIWGTNGNIQGVMYGNKYLTLPEVARLAELYNADKILLGE